MPLQVTTQEGSTFHHGIPSSTCGLREFHEQAKRVEALAGIGARPDWGAPHLWLQVVSDHCRRATVRHLTLCICLDTGKCSWTLCPRGRGPSAMFFDALLCLYFCLFPWMQKSNNGPQKVNPNTSFYRWNSENQRDLPGLGWNPAFRFLLQRLQFYLKAFCTIFTWPRIYMFIEVKN